MTALFPPFSRYRCLYSIYISCYGSSPLAEEAVKGILVCSGVVSLPALSCFPIYERLFVPTQLMKEHLASIAFSAVSSLSMAKDPRAPAPIRSVKESLLDLEDLARSVKILAEPSLFKMPWEEITSGCYGSRPVGRAQQLARLRWGSKVQNFNRRKSFGTSQHPNVSSHTLDVGDRRRRLGGFPNEAL